MLTVLVIAFALPCATPPACTCVPGPPPDSRAAVAAYAGGTTAVFEGQVVRVELAADSTAPADSSRGEHWFRWIDLVATMVVARQWKGELTDTIRVRTPMDTSMCGATLIEGRRYLVFAGARESSRGGADAPATRTSTLRTSKCGLTREWDREARRIVRLLSGPVRDSRLPGDK